MEIVVTPDETLLHILRHDGETYEQAFQLLRENEETVTLRIRSHSKDNIAVLALSMLKSLGIGYTLDRKVKYTKEES